MWWFFILIVAFFNNFNLLLFLSYMDLQESLFICLWIHFHLHWSLHTFMRSYWILLLSNAFSLVSMCLYASFEMFMHVYPSLSVLLIFIVHLYLSLYICIRLYARRNVYASLSIYLPFLYLILFHFFLPLFITFIFVHLYLPLFIFARLYASLFIFILPKHLVLSLLIFMQSIFIQLLVIILHLW